MSSVRAVASRLFWALLLLASTGCPRRPDESARPSAAPPARSVAPPAGAAAPPALTSSAPPAAPPTAPPATAPDAGAAPRDPLLAEDGTPLPQLEDRPRADSPLFLERMRLLVSAIARDEPEVALPAFFPLLAYEQVKDIQKPARDWQQRLVRAFERNVHEYHRSLGRSAASLELVAVEVDEPRVRWMKPGSEGNRIGYHRALRSRLRVRDAAGKERSFEITSLISWRGEWYVVHLSGFD